MDFGDLSIKEAVNVLKAVSKFGFKGAGAAANYIANHIPTESAYNTGVGLHVSPALDAIGAAISIGTKSSYENDTEKHCVTKSVDGVNVSKFRYTDSTTNHHNVVFTQNNMEVSYLDSASTKVKKALMYVSPAANVAVILKNRAKLLLNVLTEGISGEASVSFQIKLERTC